jgi:transcriptional regulator with PAS, ATPase and Fis domain
MMADRQFRPDLFFRLQVFPIEIPPLRDRTPDIPDLVRHFIEKKSREMKRHQVPCVSRAVMDRLMAYHWPGNIRELENAVERSMILDRSGYLNFCEIGLSPAMIPRPVMPEKSDFTPTGQTLDQVMADHIQTVLHQCKGRVEGDKGAAKVLAVHPSTLRKRMKKLDIPFGRNAG